MSKPSLTIQFSLLVLLCLGFPVLSLCAQVQVPRRTSRAQASSQPKMQASKQAGAVGRSDGAGSNQKIQFSFEQAEWKDVIPWFADQAGFSLQHVNDWPDGTFYLVDESEYTVIEALDQLNHSLRLLDPPYTLIRNRNLLVLVEADPKNYPPELIETVPVEQLDERGKYETMRCVFKFGELDIKNFKPQLDKLVAPENKSAFAVFEDANQIHVRETGAKLRVMRDLIATARKLQSARDSSFKDYRLKHTDADSFLFAARGLLGIKKDENARDDGSLVITVEPLSDRLIIKGTTTGLKEFDEVAALLDVVPPDQVDSDGPIDKPFARSYPVTSDPKLAFDVLQTFLHGRDGVNMQQDEFTGAIAVWGRKADHEIVADTLAMLEGNNGQQFAIIPIQYADPRVVHETLGKLFLQSGGAEAKIPAMVVDASQRTIMVQGTPSEVTMVKSMIAKLDGAATSVTNGLRTRTRVIQIEDDAKRDKVLDVLDSYWPSTGRTNQLRFNLVLPEDRPNLRNRLRGGPGQATPNGSGTRMNDGSGSKTDRDVQREEPPFDINYNRLRQRDPWQGSSRSIEPIWRSALRSSFHLLAKSSLAATCWISTRCQLTGLPVALIAAPRQSSSSAFPDQGSASQSEGPQGNPDYVPPDQPTSVPGDDIEIQVTDGGIVITSGDLDALDDLEDLIRSQLGQESEVQRPVFFYLKHRYADEVAAKLREVFGLSGGDGGGGGGGLVGGLVDNVLGGGGAGDLLDSFLGGSDDFASSESLEGDVRLGTDSVHNSIWVNGATETDLFRINDLIDILDRSEPPQNPELVGRFRTIPILHRDPEEVKEIVEAQLSDLIAPSGSGGESNNNQQPAGQQAQVARMIAAAAGAGGGGNAGGGNAPASEPPRARLGVDTKTGQLLVTGPPFIYQEVLRVVMELDKPQLSAPPVYVVIPGVGSTEFLKRGLKSIFGSKIEISGEGTESGSSSSDSSSSSSDDDAQQSRNASQQAQRQAQQQRQFQRELSRQQRQNNGGRGRGNAGGGGRRGGGNPGGGRGGGGRGR